MLGGGVLMPVHWGTFSLATHAWDEPVETLLSLADPNRSHLLLPHLGEAVEPAERRPATPWWRGDQTTMRKPDTTPDAAEQPGTDRLTDALPWPLD
jgi:hypothetical protein